jgi:hypothetical protein
VQHHEVKPIFSPKFVQVSLNERNIGLGRQAVNPQNLPAVLL